MREQFLMLKSAGSAIFLNLAIICENHLVGQQLDHKTGTVNSWCSELLSSSHPSHLMPLTLFMRLFLLLCGSHRMAINHNVLSASSVIGIKLSLFSSQQLVEHEIHSYHQLWKVKDRKLGISVTRRLALLILHTHDLRALGAHEAWNLTGK